MFDIIFRRKLAYKQPWSKRPAPSLAAAFAKIYPSRQIGLLVWLPSPVLSLYEHKLTCSQAKMYPRKSWVQQSWRQDVSLSLRKFVFF